MARSKHEINYILIFVMLAVLAVFQILIVIFIIALGKDLLAVIVVTVIFIAADIYSIKQLLLPQIIKSVTVDSTSIILEYRKTIVNIPYEDCKKVEHSKHGPLTERIYVYAKGYIYEIPFVLKGSQDMCRSIYLELSKINMQHVADEWFQKKFSEEAN